MHIMSSSIREKNINSNKALRSIQIYRWEKLYKIKLGHDRYHAKVLIDMLRDI